MNEAYIVLGVKHNLTVSVFGNNTEISFTDYSDGCIGMIPVFDTFENAEKYSDGICEIRQVILG